MKHWTEDTDQEAAAFFATLSDSEIRRRQDLCKQQIVTAYRLRLTDALTDLYSMEEALTQAMLARI